ncbi:phage tail assembly protein [Agrobacterium sp. CMT1]|uniref:phage tail assembly protein n=1 Tax=Agrobacterium sp. CMT1 TaxID=3128901 RepID=UPI00307863A3
MSVRYTLKTPVSHGGETYTELTFRKPRTGDLLVMDEFKGDMGKSLAMLSSIAEIPLPAFRQIELDDFHEIETLVAPLLGNSRKAPNGSTS